jgi:hypothetical protein
MTMDRWERGNEDLKTREIRKERIICGWVFTARVSATGEGDPYNCHGHHQCGRSELGPFYMDTTFIQYLKLD